MRWNSLIMMIVAAVQGYVPPHLIMGYSWGEWAAIATLIVAISSFVVWLVNMAIVKPLRTSIDMLTRKVEGIGGNADIIHKEHDQRLDDHETRIKLNEHDIAEIKESMK